MERKRECERKRGGMVKGLGLKIEEWDFENP
jgi:hypothetical protein